MKKIIAALFVSMICLLTFGQNTEVLTNKSIIELSSAGLSKKTIISKIETAALCKFTTDTKSLISLKKNGVDEDVINSMVTKMSGAATVTKSTSTPVPESTSKTTVAAETDKSEHMSPLAASKAIEMVKKEGSGIYYFKSPENILVEVDPTVFSQQKSNNWVPALTYGFGKSTKVMSVSGGEANIQFKTKQPTFYFYFDPENKSLNSQVPTWFASVTSPNEFLLIKFDTKTKVKNSRAVTTASSNSYESAQGIDDKYKRTFKSKKLEKGIYELYFEGGLEAGEYGFMYAGATATNGGGSPKVYDFGVKAQ